MSATQTRQRRANPNLPEKFDKDTVKGYVQDQAARVIVQPYVDMFKEYIDSIAADEDEADEALKNLYTALVLQARDSKIALKDKEGDAKGKLLMEGSNERTSFTVCTGLEVRNDLEHRFMTFPMIQAVITIYMNERVLGKEVPAASLGSKVVCKIPEADMYNWAIHGHSGLHFVASWWNVSHANLTQEVKKVYPTKEYFFGLAAGIDFTSSAVEKSALRSVFMATGWASDLIQLRPSHWGQRALGRSAADAATNYLAGLSNVFGAPEAATTGSSTGTAGMSAKEIRMAKLKAEMAELNKTAGK